MSKIITGTTNTILILKNHIQEEDPHKYSQLIFEKETKTIQLRKDSLLINGDRTTRYLHVKK